MNKYLIEFKQNRAHGIVAEEWGYIWVAAEDNTKALNKIIEACLPQTVDVWIRETILEESNDEKDALEVLRLQIADLQDRVQGLENEHIRYGSNE